MDSHDNTGCEPDLDLPAAKKICLDNNDVSNSFRNNSSLSDSTLHLGELFSPCQSLSSRSIIDGVDNKLSLPHHKISDEIKSVNEDENNCFPFATPEVEKKSNVSIATSDLDNTPKCVKVVENDENHCSSLSKLNLSNLSSMAFKINESLDFMDETCLENDSEHDYGGNSISDEVKCLTNVPDNNLNIDETNCINNVDNSITEDDINSVMKADSNCTSKLEATLDYTCKPDVVDELVLCQSIIKKDAMSPSCKLYTDPSLTSMSIDESLVGNLNNIPCQTTEEASPGSKLKMPSMIGIDFEDSDSEKISNNSHSTNLFNEVSGCALDYTCSKSVGFDVSESFTGTSLSNKGSEKSFNGIIECSNAENQDVNKSNSVMIGCDDLQTEDNKEVKNANYLNLTDNNVPDPENPIYDISDLKNSFISNKTFSAEEVNFLKENLLKVMELLKNDNNSFESYKVVSEIEKRELLDKIKYLESNSAILQEYSGKDVSTLQKTGQEEKIELSENYSTVCDELNKTRTQYNNLLQLVVITEANWRENKLFVDFLSDLNIAHNELFIPLMAESNQYIINHKKIFDIMLSLFKDIVKSNSFKKECHYILKTFIESSNMDKNRLPFLAKECEGDLVADLKTTLEEILIHKNCLEKEIVDLKQEVDNKSDKIKILNSTIEKLNQDLIIFKETSVMSTNPIVKETIQNVSSDVTEKLIIHDHLNESYTNIKEMKDSITALKEALSLSEENYNNISLKCEQYEVELQKMHEIKQAYQELLLSHSGSKTQIQSKCEIENRKADNQNLTDLKIRFDESENSLLGNHEEILPSYDQPSKDLSLKNSEMNQSNLSITENDLVVLQENRSCLETKLISSNDEILKLQTDLNCLNEKYRVVLADFDLYKQKYNFSEEEYIVWQEEKQSLVSELDYLKSQQDNALVEPKLKTDNEEINKKIDNLLLQLTDLETVNGTLKNDLCSLRSDSESKIDLLNNEIRGLIIKLDTAEKMLIDHDQKYSELKISYDKVCEELESKNSDLSLLTDSKEKLEKELEISTQNETLLKQKIEELQGNLNCLEAQLLSSKDGVSKLESDLNSINEKHAEILTNFDLYKQKYIFTEDESILCKEEKQSLENEVESLKSQLDSALEETKNLKCDNEEISISLKNIENQLLSEKESNKEIQESYESMKTKYEESIIEINNKTIELQNLLGQLSDLETTNANLKTELTNFFNNADTNVDLLNNEISELKIKLDTSEKKLIGHEDMYSELKISYDKVCEDLESKNSDLSSLTNSKEKLEKELEISTQNETLLKQKIEELQGNLNCLEAQLLSSKDGVSKLESELNSINEKHAELLKDFDLYKQKYIFTEDESILCKEEKQSLENEVESLKSQLDSALEETKNLKCDNEEISISLKNIENQLLSEKESNKEIQESYESMKTKYEESIIEINNKTIELQNLLGQLSDLETTNANLKTELTNFFNNADTNVDLLNNEISELKIKLDTSEKKLISHEEMYSELKISYGKVCEDLESKNSDISLLTDSKEKLEKELEISTQNETLLKQKIEELQGNLKCIEAQLHTSNDEVSKFQVDFDCLKEKYSSVVSDFDVYKQKYIFTEEECILWREEKHSLECELNSFKSKLECALEELQKLRSVYEKTNENLKNVDNQLCAEKKNCRDIESLFENIKIKYEESVAVVGNKTVEVQNLQGQLSDLETINDNLKSELNAFRCDSEHNIDILNNEILGLKTKCETSEKLYVDLEEKHNKLEATYNHICEDFESKKRELSLLSNCKEQLEKEIDILNQNNLSLKQRLTDLEKNEEYLKKSILDLNIQLNTANSKIDCMKNIEVQVAQLKNKYDILSSYHTQDKEICGEQPFCLFSELVNFVQAIIKDLILFKTKCAEEEIKLSSSQEEVSRLNVLLDTLKEEIKSSEEESVKLQVNYSSLTKQYNSLLDSTKDSNIRCNSLLENLKELESQNSACKSAIEDLKSEVTVKESIIAGLSDMKDLYESTVKENETLSSQLMEKIKECETALGNVKTSEQKYLSLKLEYSTLTNEINDLRNKNETLEMKCNENYGLYMSSKDNIEILKKEKEEIRKNFIKCEKDYQNSIDLVKKCQEDMGNLDKQYNLSISKLNSILKEKESYESQNLTLQKINDELMNRIKELNCKCLENQNLLIKFKDLEKSYELVTSKHQYLEKQLIDYGNLKRENEVLKSCVSEKDSFSNNLSISYNALNEKYNSLSDELKSLSSGVLTLVPGENSAIEIIKLIGEKLQAMKKIENDLQEEKIKCENLDEECNILNEDLKYKDVVIGDMYKDHSSKMDELKESLKKEENLRQEILLENSTLKDKIKCLDSEITKLKTIDQSPCSSCAELKGVLQKLKVDLVDNSSKVTTLQLQIEENEITNKKKIHDYRKKISSLQEELGAALNKLEDNRLKSEVACLNASIQTESLPVQISGQSGIVQSFKIKEQEEKIKKFEKENLVLKRMCQSRLQTIQELKNKLENVSKPQKNQRNVLEEVQNHQSS